jgi:flavin-binding protein dodecin
LGVGWAPNRAGIVRPIAQRGEPERLKEEGMPESVYKVIELIGTSTKSWNEAAKAAVERASETLRDLRIAEVIAQDVVITDGKVEAYRVKIKVSFKYEGHH